MIAHEDYYFFDDSYTGTFLVSNDIGLVKIDPSTLKLKNKLMPLCLPDANVTSTKECWIAGFGNDIDGKINSEN